MIEYCSCHNHGEFSNIRFLDSCIKIKDLVFRAAELGFKGIAVTEHECLSGAVKLMNMKSSIQEQYPGFKIIFGNEIYLIDESEVKNTNKYYHFILLAKDEIGWQQLKELSSRAWTRGYMERGMMRVPTTYQDLEEVVKTNPGHLIGSTACLGGELDTSICNHDVTRANNFVKWGISVFGKDDFFLEIQVADTEEQIQCNGVLIKLANHYGVKYIITTDTHYLYKDDFKIHSSFLNSRQTKDRETEKFYKYTYMMTVDEMTEILLRAGLTEEQIKTGFQNTMSIYNAIEDFDFRLSTIVPHAKIPEFKLKGLFDPYLSKYTYIDQFIHSEHVDDRYLMYLIEQGLMDKHINLDEEKLSRLDIELSVISKVSAGLNQTVSSYFLLMREVIDIAWNYSFVGAGRGSSTGFYINYLIDLVQVNPLQYNLPYWRFLNDVRFELPDIDTDLNPAQKDNIMAALKEYYGQDNVLNCITFKTESLKAAIVNAMRGLGYSNDEAQTLSALVPVDRGHVYTIDECINGNEALDLEPSPAVIDKLREYPHLLETVQKIEGLHTNASIHASAVYIFDNGYIEHNSLMRAPNGTPVTAFDMEDTNALSGLKIDLLYTDAQNKMMKCMDLLLKDGLIEWQGSLRATYNKYLHPDVLNYTNEEMWKKASSGEIANLFQWETAVGAVAIRKAQPRSVLEMATINSAIRVQSEGVVQPIDRYIMFHKNISLWYQEMYDQGLDDFEIEVMREHLLPSYGCSLQQEDFMQLVMDPNIAGFTLKESNTLRKTIAHKVLDQIAKQKELFFSCCDRQGTRKEFANYVWTFCIEPLAKYSFSVIHAVVYSIVAVQEMNLAMFFPRLYWQCACLCVNAGNSDTNFEDEDSDSYDDEEETSTKKYATANYGKIARAISNAQMAGVRITLPDINLSQPDFIPDIENNLIRYSLQAVNVVSDELLNKILTNRPYVGITDFIEKVAPTQVQMIGLIKAGAFDSLYPTKTRTFIMTQYLQMVADHEIPLRDKLTSVQLKKALELGVQFPSFTEAIRVFKFKQYIKKKQFDTAGKRYLLTEQSCITFFNSLLKSRLSLSKGEYTILPDGVIGMKPSAFDKVYDAEMKELLEHLNSEQGRKEYQTALQNQLINTLKEKYCQGSVSKWEMDTLSCYQHEHELAKVNEPMYHIRDFNSLPECMGANEIVAIAGTVIDNNKLKHTISVLTTHGVVDVKIYAGQYVRFNQRITAIDKDTGKKTVIEESWFKRGTKLVVYGQRKDNAFICKNFKEGSYNRLIGLIDEVHLDGTLKISYNRKGAKRV